MSILSYVSYGQSATDSLINQMYGMWNSVYASYNIDHMSGDIQSTKEFFEFTDSIRNRDDLNAKILKAESDLVSKDWGLDWNAGYLYNTAPGMDVADNILYKSRIQTQVSWNILDNGFIENKTRSEILENKSHLAEIEQSESNFVNQDILDNWHKVIFRFNQEKIRILDQRLQLAEKRVAISYQLQSLGKITHEELLNNLESYAEISSLYKIYRDYNENISSNIHLKSEGSLPLIDIDYNYGLEKLKYSVSDTAKQIMLENLDLENKYINEVKLSIYTRYNYYDLINNPIDNRSFLTLGVGLGVPLNFHKKEKEELYELQKQQIMLGEYEDGLEEIRLKNDMLSYLYEFRYKLKQFNTFFYKKLKLEEMLRKEQARFDVNKLDFNPLKALRWLDESMSVDIELIDLKQQLYLYVLRMLSIAPQLDVEQLIKPITLDEIEIIKIQKQSKEVYVWSKTLENHSIGTLVNYCAINEITKVVVSASASKEKFNSFAEKCSKLGIEVDAMIGDNQLINNYSSAVIAQKLEGIDLTKISGIHLDVEPQTFDDWKGKESYYAQEYLKMFNVVRTWCTEKELTVSVSLPTYFPTDVVKEIQQNEGRIYFMCYENVTSSFLQKKLSDYKGSTFVIALRPEDFSNAAEMDNKMKELKELLAPERFIIHDLERLLKFAP